MKFLIATNHSYMLWQFRRELIAELQKHGEVVISTPFAGHEDDFQDMGCQCIETPLDRRSINPARDLKLFRFYLHLLKREKPDAVITYSIKPNIYMGYACRRAGITCFANVQGLGTAFQSPGIARVVSVMYREALRNARAVFFENTGNASEFVRRRIVARSRITVLRGAGVNPEYFAKQPYPEETDGIHFLYLGRFMKEKGIDELIETARILHQEYGERVHFDLVGFFEDEYEEAVDKLVQEGIAAFHGFQSEPRPYYAAAHCVVLPSYHEGMSNVLLEAASTGRALVTTDIPGCREAVEEGVSGFLCRKADSGSLIEACRRFMELTAAERKEMGEAGRRKMEKEFDRKAIVEKTLQIVTGIPCT